MKFSYIYGRDGNVEAINLEIVKDLTLTVYRDEWDKFAEDFRDNGMSDYRFGDVSMNMGFDEWCETEDEFDAIDEAVRNNVLPEDVNFSKFAKVTQQRLQREETIRNQRFSEIRQRIVKASDGIFSEDSRMVKTLAKWIVNPEPKNAYERSTEYAQKVIVKLSEGILSEDSKVVKTLAEWLVNQNNKDKNFVYLLHD